MILKRKSFSVVILSGVVVSVVLVLTLVGYLMYLELKSEEFRASYHRLLHKVQAKAYGKYIEHSKLDARVEEVGVLKGQPVLEGVITNKGYRDISDIVVKVKFLDSSDAVMYEVFFRPYEPSLGVAGLTQMALPYLSANSAVIIRSGGSLPFKKILSTCPAEIVLEMRKPSKGSGRRINKLVLEVLSIDFPKQSA